MNKRLKAFISIVLLLCILSSPISVLAATAEDINSSIKDNSQTVAIDTTKETTGSLDVDLMFDLPIRNERETILDMALINQNNEKAEFNINLKNANGDKQLTLEGKTVQVNVQKMNSEGQPVLDNEEYHYLKITFEGLAQGDYQINLKGNSFIEYTSEKISLKDFSKRIYLSNTKGTFALGDVNGDKIIDTKDYELLIDKVGNKEDLNLTRYDLNCDGKIDVIDLSYIAHNIKQEGKAVKIEDTNPIINLKNIEAPKEDEKTEIQGDIADLFTGKDEVVGLKSKSDEAISETNPVTLEMKFKKPVTTEQIVIEPNQMSDENAPTKLEVTVEQENGETKTIRYENGQQHEVAALSNETSTDTIKIDLGNQVAVKKITIKILETKTNTNLAEIAEVEFLNNVYEEIPAPKMDIPEGLTLVAESEGITAKWIHAVNITGYKVKVKGENKEQVLETTNNTIKISELKNYTEYKVSVESVNGKWESGYCEEKSATPLPTRLPPVPESITTSGKYLRIDVAWKAMDDTQSYNIYYRKAGETEYQKIENIAANKYTINNLENEVEYEIVISGNNHLGEGKKSNIYNTKTIGIDPAITRNYKLINTSNGENQTTAHITNVSYPRKSDTENFDNFDIVDDDYSSYWQYKNWEAGGYNDTSASPIITFDNTYKMDTIILIPADDQQYSYDYWRIKYWNSEVNGAQVPNTRKERKTSSNGKIYYEFKFAQPIEANKIQVNLATYLANRITIAEMKFYYYDDLEEQVSKLFKDDLRVELADGVTEARIKELEDRANTVDEVSKEYHPNREVVLNDLNYARKILNDTKISDVILVDQTISNAKNSHLGFSYTLNDLQPLGIVANAGDQLAIYVGSASTNTNLELVCTQYFPEYSAWKKNVTKLSKGQNIITVPQIMSRDVEKGGAVYVRYTNANATSTPIKVRVSGGQKIPVLDVHGVTDENQVKEKISTYIEELKAHVGKLGSYYSSKGQTYQEATSILNSTDIVMDDMMLSVPASKALQGITNGLTDTNAQTQRLYDSTKAFEEMIGLFYKEKGLSKDAANAKNKWPGSRLNIRYTRMFDGAFMYASGEHIGIGLGSVSPLMSGKTLKEEADGTYSGAGYFGWGISHEIGHVIDQGAYCTAEITNNIYSLLAQTADDKSLSRLETSNKYEGIYKKVTSHTTGTPSDVFVALGMYWQLHLAYDDGPTLTSTDTFYSRLHTSYRNDTLGNKVDKNNKLICYASDAAGKDLTDFFEAWGLKASDAAKAYLAEKGYEKETRPIYYINDGARRYRMNGGTALKTTVSANLELVNATKQTKITFNVAKEADKVLGYEIRRNGESVGFTTKNEYVDQLNALNNRVLNYEVVAYDKLLNEIGRVTLDPVKVQNDGTIAKNTFSVNSNMRNETDENEYESENPVTGTIKNILDANNETVFNGNTRKVSTEKATPYIVVDLNQQLPICGLRYTAGVENGALVANTVKKYRIYVSTDNSNWVKVKEGTFNISAANPTTQIYFDAPGSTGGNQLYTSTAGYVKIEAVGNSGISGAEIDLISPPGDNISLEENDVYVLEQDYRFAEGENNVIKAGSVIFKGEYRGNPAYNAGLIIDGNGGTVSNYSQIFMAELPENAALDEIASGYWIAYMTKEKYEEILETKKAKVQLYRVNNAETLEGQRLVSDTFYINLKAYNKLTKTILTKNENQENNQENVEEQKQEDNQVNIQEQKQENAQVKSEEQKQENAQVNSEEQKQKDNQAKSEEQKQENNQVNSEEQKQEDNQAKNEEQKQEDNQAKKEEQKQEDNQTNNEKQNSGE